MLRIDSHQHFWKFDPARDAWINDDMQVIRRDFLPADLEPLLNEHGFDGSVVVQSDQSEEENLFQLENAAKHPFIRGVVGWTDLRSPALGDRLSQYSQYDKLKGFRHVLQGEADRAFMLQPSFLEGIGQLRRHNFTYDILVFPDQLQHVLTFVRSFPDQPFVIDHIAKPFIKKGEVQPWKKEMEAIAACDNVYCKVSGMVTEADWKNWKKEDFVPYLDTVTEAFGVKRLMFGSDWPVCLVAAGYTEMLEIVAGYFSRFSEREQALIFGGNAVEFYHLK